MRKIILSVLGLAGLIVGGAAAFLWISGGSGEPSTEVTAPTIAVSADTADTQSTEPAGTTATGSQVVYSIDKTQSSVQFTLDEVLRGAPTRVIGTTSEVAGEILVDFSDPSASQLGEIVVNARTFTTGSSFRDRAVRGPILNSADDEFEFANFVPTAVAGLPDQVAVGDEVSFMVTGDFTIAGATSSVTFDITLTIGDGQIDGSGIATVLRTDFGLTIPSAPGVANVSEEVGLQIDFVALAA